MRRTSHCASVCHLRASLACTDLDLLKNLNSSGAVRNLHERRKDLYSVSWVKKTGRDDELLKQGAARAPKIGSRRKAIVAGWQSSRSAPRCKKRNRRGIGAFCIWVSRFKLWLRTLPPSAALSESHRALARWS